MAYIDVEIEDTVDISVREFFREMSDSEKDEMRKLLGVRRQMEPSFSDDDFDEKAKKLIGNRWRLTLEDEETVMKIANKIC
jgi:hypothetical protein